MVESEKPRLINSFLRRPHRDARKVAHVLLQVGAELPSADQLLFAWHSRQKDSFPSIFNDVAAT